MVQVYFFTVTSLLLAGLILLINERLLTRFPSLKQYLGILENTTFRLVVGLVAIVVALFNLFQNNAASITIGEAIYQQGSTFLIGDLIPALLGLWTGAMLAANFFSQRYNLHNWVITALNRCMIVRIPLGVVTLIAGVLHLVIPQALFF